MELSQQSYTFCLLALVFLCIIEICMCTNGQLLYLDLDQSAAILKPMTSVENENYFMTMQLPGGEPCLDIGYYLDTYQHYCRSSTAT